MIYFEKSQPAPTSLAIEKAKPSGAYNQADVLQQLEKDFCNKCYICEQKAPTTINIEHFIPHKGNKNLEFSWDNLFYACGHCNNSKLHHFDNLLNCTLASDQIEEAIRCKIDPFPKEKPYFDIIIPSPKADETKKLLEKVFNGEHTPNKTLESANLRSLLLKEIRRFLNDLDNYFNDEDKDYALSRIKQHLSKSSAFTSFKRWIVRERYSDDFAYLLG